jgi:exopolysaccharide biosynthesis polyprenyl glycosylphosphotransferase
LILSWRYAFARIIEAGSFVQRVLIAGTTPSGGLIASAIRQHLDAHYEIVGFVGHSELKTFEDVPVLGHYEELGRLAAEMNASTIVMALNEATPPELFKGILECQEVGVQIAPMPVLFEQITGRVPVEHIGENWYVALPLEHPSIGGIYPLLKRALDIIVALVGLIIFALIMPVIALAIKLDSPGPLFYKQTRVGRWGKEFVAWKLRSMVVGAEKGEAVWAARNDPRVTRVGRILRKTRIDEFPQLVNILRGEMSAVGPRPERPEFVAQLVDKIPFYRIRHAVNPGMAGWAMINGDYVDSVEDALTRVEYDLYYIKHQSIWLDILILFRTIGEILKLKGR